MVTLTDREKGVIECLVVGWLNSDCLLYGHLSYDDVIKTLNTLGVNDSAALVKEHIEIFDMAKEKVEQ